MWLWSQVQLHQPADDSIPVNESIISLLLKLHSQLSGRLDSFSLDEPEPQSDEPIGELMVSDEFCYDSYMR